MNTRNVLLFFSLILLGASITYLYLKINSVDKYANENRQQTFIVKGSIPYWDQENAFVSFKKHPEVFSYINLFWYFIDEKGGLHTYDDANEDKRILKFAQDHNVKTQMVVTNLPQDEGTTWDSKRVEYILHDKNARNKEIQQIIAKAENLGFDGVIIDYESVNSSQKSLFSNYINELAEKLHNHNLFLAIALHPKTRDDDDPGSYQDWAELAKHADQLQIMAYGQHWDEGPAGPIASVPWIEKIIQYALSKNIPREKLFLGMPLYGYSWQKNNHDSAKGLTFSDVTNLLKNNSAVSQWDGRAQSHYLLYTNNGDRFEVWYEDAESIKAKLALAEKYQIQGITFWHLGEEDETIWNLFTSPRR